MQPIRRFGFDAAIIFSDILIVPFALGQTLTFVEGEGPKLNPPLTAENFDHAARYARPDNCPPVYETVRLTRKALPDQTTLLGFCGAPWTVATYMIAGEGTSDQAPARLFAYREPALFERLMDLSGHCVRSNIWPGQIAAGADAVQLFDTWAGVLPPEEFHRWCVIPAAKIVTGPARTCARREDHRLSARYWDKSDALCRRRSCRCGWARLDGGFEVRHATYSASVRCRAISIRWRCAPVALRSIAASMPSWLHCPAGR